MSIVFLIIWYIFLILLPIGCLVIRILTYPFASIIQEIDTYILLGALIYGAYMLIYVSCKSGSKDSKKEPLISNDHIDLFRDHWFKYLFCLCVGTVFIPQLITNLEASFITYKGKVWYVVVDKVFSQIIIPLIVLIDTFMIPRRRVPSPLCDIGILFLIVIVFFVLDLIRIGFKSFVMIIGLLLSNLLFSFNGYVLYDYILYKKVGGSSGFNLFNK